MRIFLITLSIILSFSSLAVSLEAFYFQSPHRILFTGESHRDDTNRAKLAASLSVFKAMGGDTLGLEMIESHKQYLLDNYLNYIENSDLELSTYLTKRWQYNTKSYMRLISTARELELNLLAIDLDKSKWPKETEVFPVPPDISKVREAREEHMAKILCDSNYQRIVVLIGSFHSLKKFLPTQIENECSLNSSTFKLSNL